jgi:hypothetical protein
MPSRIPNILILCTFLVAFAPVLSAQQAKEKTLTLRSGDVLTGKIIASNDRVIWFHDHARGDVTVQRDQIASGVKARATVAAKASKKTSLPPTSHVRFVAKSEGDEGGLETAVTTWSHKDTGSTLLLVGAVHIGDAGYYGKLQEILDATDIVLFEGVGKPKNAAKEEEVDVSNFDALFQLQVGLKDMLGLAFQKDSMQYGHRHWKNADVDMVTLKKEMDDRKVSLPTDNIIVRGILKFALMIFNPDRMPKGSPLQKKLKQQMAAMLGDVDVLMKKVGGLQDVLIEYRNNAAMAVLRTEVTQGPKGRKLSLFYGAAHLPGMCKTLVEDGWVCTEASWLRAWQL